LSLSGCDSTNPADTYVEDGPFVDADIETVNPAAYGWSAAKLEAVRVEAESLGSSALMILTDGEVVAAWGNVKRTYLVHSIRKSVLSILYGIYTSRGTIDLSATLEDLQIDDLSPLTDQEKQATVADLLKSRSGVYHDAASVSSSDAASQPPRGSHMPGTHFWYNNWDFNVLGTIFEQETDMGIFDALEKHLAGPLGMEDFSQDNMYYEFAQNQSMHPAYHMRLSARDLARVGQLILQNGSWEGVEIVSEAWIRESTTAYSNLQRSGTGGGFGYMWWIANGSTLAANNVIEDGAVTGSGSGGHKLTILPSLNTVVVHRVNTDLFTGPKVRGSQYDQLLSQIIRARLQSGA